MYTEGMIALNRQHLEAKQIFYGFDNAEIACVKSNIIDTPKVPNPFCW